MTGLRRRPSIRGLAFAVLVVAAILVPAIWIAGQANAPEQVTGFVLDIRSRPPLGVDSFDLGTGDGRRLTFDIGQLDVENGFNAAHLVMHKLTLQLVTVSYRRDGDRLIAVRLADGPAGPPLASGAVPSTEATGSP